MTHVITQSCCNDAACTAVCPVDCIHPRPDEATFSAAESLYIDAEACIDCGACVEECPVGAIVPEDELNDPQARYLDFSARYFESRAYRPTGSSAASVPVGADLTGVRVAVVGSGPAAMYAVWELLEHRGVEIHVYERSMAPFGLIRTGVAPDHQATKAVAAHFARAARKAQVTMHLGVEVGTHVTHDELSSAHSAVIYATGASADRSTQLPGEQLAGVHSATDFVGWYNGDPNHADARFDFSGTRAVVIGNGNVALDVARVLVADPDDLAKTDIADAALKALRQSNIGEVVVVGRRAPAQAAYTYPELFALLDLRGVDVVIDPTEAAVEPVTAAQLDDPTTEPAVRLKADLATEIAGRPSGAAPRRITLRYLRSPVRFTGTEHVSSVQLVHNQLVRDNSGVVAVADRDGVVEEIETSLVLTSVGYRGLPISGVPFDPARAVIPNDQGRVLQSTEGAPWPGVYATGWIKRGPSGVIGTNKQCARETVRHLVEDVAAGVVVPAGDYSAFESLLRSKQPDAIDFHAWRRIDAAERRAGLLRGRPRLKITSLPAMLRVLHEADQPARHPVKP